MPDDVILDPSSAAPPRPAGSRSAPSRRRARRAARAALAVLAGMAVLAGLATLYWYQSRTAPFNSDGAANVLQAQAIMGGNPLLRGWWTSDVSFYSTDLVQYALVTALRGVTPEVVHLCGALSYALTVLLAGAVASGGAEVPAAAGGRGLDARWPGWPGAAVAAAIMLAPSILGGTEVFLENPDHAGTAVPALLVLLVLDRAGHRRAAPWAVAALLTVATVGDELTLAAVTVPLALVSLVRLVRLVSPVRLAVAGRADRGPCRAPAGPRRRDAALLAAAAASVLLAKLAGAALRAAGGFDLRPLAGVTAARLPAVAGDARTLAQTLLLLFGANQPGAPHQPQAIRAHLLLVGLAGLHVAGLVAAGAGLAAGISVIARGRADRVTAVLVAAVAVLLGAGVFTTLLRSLSNAHEVAVLLPFGAVLAGRAMAARARNARHTPRQTARPGARPAVRRLTTVMLAGWVAVGLAELGYAATWPAMPPAQQAVAAWLAARHQHEGLAGYWQATATTVTSGGQVLVAPVVLTGGAAAADRWESSAAWYQPGQRAATFVIAVTSAVPPGGGLTVTQARARFGPPAGQRRIGPEVIMLYRYNLLTRLVPASFPGPAGGRGAS